MSPLEEYQEARRSGATRTHPDTLENWPDKDTTSKPPLPPEPKQPKGLPSSIHKPRTDYHQWAQTIAIIILAIWCYLRPIDTVTITTPSKPKVIYKTKTKTVYIPSNDDTWRRRLCYFYSDPKACKLYGKNVPRKVQTAPWGDGVLGRYIKTIQGR